MEICETCKKPIKNKRYKVTETNDKEANISFCNWKCVENFKE